MKLFALTYVLCAAAFLLTCAFHPREKGLREYIARRPHRAILAVVIIFVGWPVMVIGEMRREVMKQIADRKGGRDET